VRGVDMKIHVGTKYHGRFVNSYFTPKKNSRLPWVKFDILLKESIINKGLVHNVGQNNMIIGIKKTINTIMYLNLEITILIFLL